VPIATPEVYAEMLNRARDGKFAYPAINVTSSQTITAALQGFAEAESDGILQVSVGGAEYGSGSTIKNRVTGSLALAAYATEVAKNYGITVALHTDHCAKQNIDSWVRPLLEIEAGQVADGKLPTLQTPRWAAAAVPPPAALAPHAPEIEEAAALLNKADKVAIFAGAGVEGAHDEVIALADALKAPIGHSLRGKHFIQYDNPFDVGMTGLLGYGAAAEGMNDADVLILLGTDFPYDQFLPSTPTIQVDTHAEKLGRRTGVGPAIHAQVKPFIEALLPHLRTNRSDSFLKSKIKKHSEIMHAPVGAYTRNVEKMRPIHPEYAAHLLNETAATDAIFTADTGMCNVWTARYIDPLGTRRLIGSLLHGSMANALPMALGAQVAYPGRQVVSVSGDGGLSMLLGELITAKMYDLPVKVVVFNNSTLGMVKLEMLVNGLPDFQTDVPDTNYADIARAIGFHAERVEDASRLEDAYREAFAAPGPALVEVITDPNALSLPPAITGGQVIGFATAMSKIVLNRGIAEAFSMATSNMRNIPRL